MNQTKKRILEVATKLSEDRAYPNITVAMIADELRISRTLIYHHYTNLNSVITAVLEAAIENNNETLMNQGRVNKHELFAAESICNC